LSFLDASCATSGKGANNFPAAAFDWVGLEPWKMSVAATDVTTSYSEIYGSCEKNDCVDD